jgi:hypothetical protein
VQCVRQEHVTTKPRTTASSRHYPPLSLLLQHAKSNGIKRKYQNARILIQCTVKKSLHSTQKLDMQQVCKSSLICRTQCQCYIAHAAFDAKIVVDVLLSVAVLFVKGQCDKRCRSSHVKQEPAYMTAQFSSLAPFLSLPLSLVVAAGTWPDAAA